MFSEVQQQEELCSWVIRGLVSEELRQTEFLTKDATKKGQRWEKDENAEQDERDQLTARGRQKKRRKNRVGLKVRDRRERKTKGWKYQFAHRNYLRKVRLRKEKRIRSMPENIISRYCHHRAPFLSAREREEEENRGGERERERKKKESSCFVLHIIHWGNDLVHARYQPTRSAPLNGTIRRANTFGQVGAFMNKTWPPSHVRHRPLQFHTGHGQDRDPAALYWALDRFSYLRHSVRTNNHSINNTSTLRNNSNVQLYVKAGLD